MKQRTNTYDFFFYKDTTYRYMDSNYGGEKKTLCIKRTLWTDLVIPW